MGADERGDWQAVIVAEEEGTATASVPDRLAALGRALASAEATTSDAWVARGRLVKGRLHRYAGDMASAREEVELAYTWAHATKNDAVTAEAATEIGAIAFVRADLELARTRLSEAVSLVEPAPIDATMHLAMTEAELGAMTNADRLYRQAILQARASKQPGRRAMLLVNLAVVRLAQGSLEESEALTRQALALCEDPEHRLFAIVARAQLGHIYFADGRYREAEAAARQLVDALEGSYPILVGHHGGALGMALALQGRFDESEAAFALAHERVLESGSVSLLAAYDLQRGMLLHARKDPPAVRRLLRAAQKPAARSLTLRILGGQLAALAGELFVPDAHHAPRRVLAVTPDASWFRVENNEPASLKRRKALQGVLRELVKGAQQSSGTAVSPEALIAAGWPAERILPEAANNRLYVAISTLRRLGLADVLLTRSDGYLLDPSAEIRGA